MNEQHRRYDLSIIPVEVRFERAVQREKNRYVEESIKQLDTTGNISNNTFREHQARLGFIIRNNGQAAIKAYGRSILRDVSREFKSQRKSPSIIDDIFNDDNFWQRLASAWFVSNAASKVTGISLTTREDLNAALVASVGASIPEREDAISKLMDMNKMRSRVIARTESHSAAMYSSTEVAKRIEQDTDSDMLKAWLPVQDERTRLSHGAMVSVPPIPLESDFIVNGETMSRPSDPRGSADNVINCRCVLTYEVL